MVAARVLTVILAALCAACSTTSSLAPSPSPGATAGPTGTAPALPSATPVPLPQVTPFIDVDLANALQISPPYALEPPRSSDLDQLSGNILGLPSDLADIAGAGFAPSDFPMAFRFASEAETLVGVIAVIAMPPEVAETPGLLEAIAAAVALEVNAIQAPSYQTIEGVKVGVVRGPIANTLALYDGHLVMAQSGQPSVDPGELMAAVLSANASGFSDVAGARD